MINKEYLEKEATRLEGELEKAITNFQKMSQSLEQAKGQVTFIEGALAQTQGMLKQMEEKEPLKEPAK